MKTKAYIANASPTRSTQPSSFSIQDQQLVLWDIPCQPRSVASIKSHLGGAHAAIIACSAVDRKSFDFIDTYVEQLQALRSANKNFPIILIVTKCDLVRQVSHAEICAKAQTLGFHLVCETSAKDNRNVETLAGDLAQLITDRVSNPQAPSEMKVIGYDAALPSNSPPLVGGSVSSSSYSTTAPMLIPIFRRCNSDGDKTPVNSPGTFGGASTPTNSFAW